MENVIGPIAVFLVLFPLLAVGIYVACGTYVGGRRYASLEEFVASVEPSIGLRGTVASGWNRSLTSVRFAGTRGSGRATRITFQHHRAGKAHYHTVHFFVAIDPTVDLKIRREGLLDRFSRWIGFGDDLKTGSDDFDSRYWIQSSTPLKTLDAAPRGLEAAVEGLFERLGASELKTQSGWLEVTMRAEQLDPVNYATALVELELAAQSFEPGAPEEPSRPIKTASRGIRRQLRLALEPHAARRCALCHDAFEAGESDLVSCDRCHAVLHDECWRELGRCPVFGCASTRETSLRAR